MALHGFEVLTMAETILVVDDDQDFLDSVASLLRAAGYEVVTATTESEAMEVGIETRPDVILLDLLMERADSGFAIAHQFRNHPETQQASIIIVTGQNDVIGHRYSLNTPEEREWIKADMFLEKPFRPEDLIGHIRQLVEHKDD
jgi:CheY-like chemotaxis protein